MMKVSIIIPVYNVEPYIERCLRSVMDQTYPHIECIVVDDCSPDHSIAICERLIKEYQGTIQFQILHHEHNRGLSAARNTGTAAATGDYIYYLDSDDEIMTDCIELMVHEADKHPNVEMIIAAVKSIPFDSYYSLPCYSHYQYLSTPLYACYLYNKPKQDFPVYVWNRLTLKSFLIKHNIWFKEGIIHEDELWSHIATRYLTSFAVLPQQTYIHRTDIKDSIMHTTTEGHRSSFYIKVANEIITTLKDEHTALLQFYKVYITYLLGWYKYLPKNEYQQVRRNANRFLLHRHKYLTALFTHFFFKWNNALHLRKYEPQLSNYIQKKWEKEAIKINTLITNTIDIQRA